MQNMSALVIKTGLTSLTVKAVELVYHNNPSNLSLIDPCLWNLQYWKTKNAPRKFVVREILLPWHVTSLLLASFK